MTPLSSSTQVLNSPAESDLTEGIGTGVAVNVDVIVGVAEGEGGRVSAGVVYVGPVVICGEYLPRTGEQDEHTKTRTKEKKNKRRDVLTAIFPSDDKNTCTACRSGNARFF